MTNMKKRVAVLMGGWNGEREVSLSSGRGVVAALQERGYEVIPIELTRNLPSLLEMLTPKPDVLFMCALHGQWVEDGCLQGMLEILGIPYTNSSPLASALAMDKPMALRLFREAGISCPEGKVVKITELLKEDILAFPYVIKPLREGSSLGVYIIHNREDLVKAQQTWQYGDECLAERYIPGREIQVAILGDRAIGAIEIRPKEEFYDYHAKYTEGCADHIMPANIPEKDYQEALELALKAHKALGCESVTRVDLRYDDIQNPAKFYVLEVNTQPGLTPLSLVPEIAAYHGMNYGDLLEWMIENPRYPH